MPKVICWRCEKKFKKNIPGAKLMIVCKWDYYYGILRAELPQPICEKCIKEFKKWLTLCQK